MSKYTRTTVNKSEIELIWNSCVTNRVSATDSTTAVAADTYNGDVEYYIAAYPYESTEAGDLTFSAGEMVMVIKKEGDWWTGTISNRTGMFPSNYVQKADVGGTATATAAIESDVNSAYEDTYKVSILSSQA